MTIDEDGRTPSHRVRRYSADSDLYAALRTTPSGTDRLARSMKDLQDIVHELKAKGVALRATEQPINTGTAAGEAFLGMLGVFAEFETNLRRERQLDGIAAAKARGVYKGRKAHIDPAAVQQLREQERLGPSALAKRLGIGRASVYRVLGKGAA
jgi:DNA invertase Pin-like site-specific DNA recombinase